MRALLALTLPAVLIVLCLEAPPARAVDLPPGFETETIATGLDLPTGVAWAPDGRAFVAEKGGTVRVVTAAGRLLGAPLIDLSEHVNETGDRGLLGIAVDADFEDNGYLYLLYVNDPSGQDSTSPASARLTRITVRPDNTVAGGADPETIVLGRDSDGPCPDPAPTVDCFPADNDSHTIGTVRADPDGTLWVGSGDGDTLMGTRKLRTYDESSLAGKILHVDREGRGLPGHPRCPGRPLEENCTKVYASGFRNPFRFLVRASGAPIAGDVGEDSYEEVDVLRPGGDYGWPCYEGPIRTPGYGFYDECRDLYAREGTAAASLGPSWSYAHAGPGYAVTVGPEYTGTSYPAGYRGAVFVGDYARGWVKRLTLDGDTVTSASDFMANADVLDLSADPDGDLVVVGIGDGTPGTGVLYRVVYSPGNAAPIAAASATPASGRGPLTVAFSSAGSRDPDGDRLSYAWDFGDGSPGSASPNPTHVYTDRGAYDAQLRVSDGRGRSAIRTVRVTVSGPTATILSPSDGSAYRAGDTIALSGKAVDLDGDPLPASALRWDVTLVHDAHVHPSAPLTGRTASFDAAEDHDADSYYRVTLTATDDAGAQDRRTITLRPRTVALRLESDPPGASLSYGFVAVTAPYDRRSTVGLRTTIGAAPSFVRDGRTYELVGWSDGGAQVHAVTVPDSDVELVARYRDVTPAGPGSSPPGGETPGSIPPPGRGAKVAVTWPRTGAIVSSLRGTATDPDGVRTVQVAVVLVEKTGCRWWSARRRRLEAKPASCDYPHWITAKIGTRATWAASLAARLPKDKYTVMVRVTDRGGARTDVKYRSRRLGR